MTGSMAVRTSARSSIFRAKVECCGSTTERLEPSSLTTCELISSEPLDGMVRTSVSTACFHRRCS